MWQETPAEPSDLSSQTLSPQFPSILWPVTSPGQAPVEHFVRPLASLQSALTHTHEIAMGAGFWRTNGQAVGMSVRTEQRGESAWLLLAGELDRASASLVEECLAVAQAENDSVTLDFEDVTFMDSSGIDVLVRASKRADNQGGQILVVNSHTHRRVFAICHADFLLDGNAA
ncbi:MAG: STAS domain-containing protein [Actinomycetota bacterium]